VVERHRVDHRLLQRISVLLSDDRCVGKNFVNIATKAIDYVREYMRRLVPHASVVGEQNANSLQKAVVNAMTLDHDQDGDGIRP